MDDRLEFLCLLNAFLLICFIKYVSGSVSAPQLALIFFLCTSDLIRLFTQFNAKNRRDTTKMQSAKEGGEGDTADDGTLQTADEEKGYREGDHSGMNELPPDDDPDGAQEIRK